MDDDGPFSEIAKRAGHTCGGSVMCTAFSLDPNVGACNAASGEYDDNDWYTSRVWEHCTAMFACDNYNGNCWAGWFLKE